MAESARSRVAAPRSASTASPGARLAVVGMMIIPLPAWLLDLLIVVNLAFA